MTGAPQIRLYRPLDLPQIRTLDAQVQPYRPEDQPEVEEMFLRARNAQLDPEMWAPIPTSDPSIDHIERDFLSFWVAFLEGDREQIIGVVGVGRHNPQMIPALNPYAQDLRDRQDYVELLHLRVAPNTRGYGVGSRLCQAVMDWSRQNGYKMLLVNTTTPQHPARKLYEKLGFLEKARTYVGLYELVWMEKLLTS
jgi:GNAT superfamily N-acetyltransferase